MPLTYTMIIHYAGAPVETHVSLSAATCFDKMYAIRTDKDATKEVRIFTLIADDDCSVFQYGQDGVLIRG